MAVVNVNYKASLGNDVIYGAIGIEDIEEWSERDIEEGIRGDMYYSEVLSPIKERIESHLSLLGDWEYELVEDFEDGLLEYFITTCEIEILSIEG